MKITKLKHDPFLKTGLKSSGFEIFGLKKTTHKKRDNPVCIMTLS